MTYDLWFDEINVLDPPAKNLRKEIARALDALLRKFFRVRLKNILDGTYAEEQDYEHELVELYMKAYGEMDENYTAKASRFALYVEQTTQRVLSSVPEDTEFSVLYRQHLPIDRSVVPKSVLKVLAQNGEAWDRVNEIAVNEAGWIANYEDWKNARGAGAVTKTWMTILDGRERMTHRNADGQTVPVNMPFHVGGSEMMFPLDDSLGAPPDEIVNCRCQAIY